MFAVPNNQKCPARAYKVYAEKRPAEMETNDAPFTLTINNVKSGNNDVPQTDIRDLKQLRRGRKRERNYAVACSRTLGREHRFRREN